jgi:hypothetical protein
MLLVPSIVETSVVVVSSGTSDVVALAFLDNVAPVLSKVDISDAVETTASDISTIDGTDATLTTNGTTTTTSDVSDETTATDISTIDSSCSVSAINS